MSRFLCSFPGKYGDMLWSLPTVRAISQMVGEKVDFAVMPQYENILPLLQAQSYIDQALIIKDWFILNSNCGDQPWHPPRWVDLKGQWARTWHLGYRAHPGLSGQPNMALIDFIAWQQGIRFPTSPIPFISAEAPQDLAEQFQDVNTYCNDFVVLAFNEMYADLKERFKKRLLASCQGIHFVYPDKMPWAAAAWVIATSMVFVGDRSAMHVIAHGVGKKLITYEPHPARNKQGHLGTVFSCPYGQETALPLSMNPEDAAEAAAKMVKQMKEEEIASCA